MIEVPASDPSPPVQPDPRSTAAVLRRLGNVILIAFATVLTFASALMMFSAFMFYDDEGYVLTSLRNFATYGGLYREVYSQYGPFTFVFYGLLQTLGLDLTHTAGRIVTLIAWSGAALACAALVGRATTSFAARLAVLSGVFVYLWIMVSEPTHPGGLIASMVALLAWLGYRWIDAERPTAWAILIGAGAATLFLTKINIGVFAAASALSWFVLHHENNSLRRWAPLGLMASAAIFPFALMRPLLGTPWVQTYALLFASSATAALGAAAIGAGPRLGWRALRTGVWAALGVIIIVLGVILARGSTPHDVLEGLLLGPLRHPANFSLNFPWPTGARVAAFASMSVFVLAWWLRRRAWAGLDSAIAVLRLATSAALAATIARFPAISPDNFTFAYAAPCLWLFLWPLSAENSSALAARRWVGLLFLGQYLHAFPVPGSQIAWGTFLALPIAALGAWPAVKSLAARWPVRDSFARVVRFTLIAIVLVFAVTTTWKLVQVGRRFEVGRNLDLPGAESIRLPENASALFQILTANAVAHGDMLFSEPGMFSFNLWSGLPTPTLKNVTHWFSLLQADQQHDIIRTLEAHPRACVIIHREHIEFLTKRGLKPAGPLHDYIAAHFKPAFTIDNFEFCVRQGRHVAPLLLAEVYDRSTPSTEPASGRENTLLKFNVFLPPGRAVAQVEVVPMNAPAGTDPLVLNRHSTRVEANRIRFNGDPIEKAAAQSWPFTPRGLTQVSLVFDRGARRFPSDTTLVVLRGTEGEVLGLLRIQPGIRPAVWPQAPSLRQTEMAPAIAPARRISFAAAN